MTARMNARWLLLFAFLGCAPADASEDAPAESTESDLTTYGRGVVATGGGYWANQLNVGRELDLAGAANVPGVLTSSHSTSVYAHAATVELVAWTNVSTNDGELVLWIKGKPATRQGKAAKALYEKLNLPALDESGAMVKRTPGGSVTCYEYSDFYQCALTGLTDIQAK
jgi:hypothetical protein